MPLVKISEEAHKALKEMKTNQSMAQTVNQLILNQKTPIENLIEQNKAFHRSWCSFLELLSAGKYVEAKKELKPFI